MVLFLAGVHKESTDVSLGVVVKNCILLVVFPGSRSGG